MVSKKKEEPEDDGSVEKNFAPLAFLAGEPTNPFKVPFINSTPEGMAHVHTAPTPSEADLIRQMLRDAGFHVEYVPPVTTAVFGTSGSNHVFVRADQEKEAREFLNYLQEASLEEQEGET